MEDDDNGLPPATAGLLMLGLALLGGGFLVGLWFMNKSDEPLYRYADPGSFYFKPGADGGTPREMQTATNLWKDKQADTPPAADAKAHASPVQPKPATPPATNPG